MSSASSPTSSWLSPPAGSSSSSSAGSPMSARANSTRFCVANGRLAASAAATSRSSSRSSTPSSRAAASRSSRRADGRPRPPARNPVRPRWWAPTSTLSRTVMVGNRATFWNVRPRPSAGHPVPRQAGDPSPAQQDLAGVAAVDVADAVEQRRLAGAVRPDQPADLPGATSNDTRSSATSPPKRTTTSLTSSSVSPSRSMGVAPCATRPCTIRQGRRNGGRSYTPSRLSPSAPAIQPATGAEPSKPATRARSPASRPSPAATSRSHLDDTAYPTPVRTAPRCRNA